ncbi:hypothetical protein ACMXYV_07540 [Neptuniibacter sp. SY11_33]|uniref:hypothetical protein n=1 Tax=Neptuniibacter sp. SY11_33 TaxID=3398215 RepID=UPI0039F44B4B
MSIYAFSTARIISPDKFKKATQLFHREVRSDFDLSLSQAREMFARALGFSDYHGLQNNDSIVIELDRMLEVKDIPDSVKEILFEFFFCSHFINTGSENTLCLAVKGLGKEGSYVSPHPHVDHGQGLFREGFDHIRLGQGVALPLEDWKVFVNEVETEVKQSTDPNTSDLCELILHRFNQIDSVQYYYAPDLFVGDNTDLEKFIAESQSKADIRKALADWYSLQDDFATPLNELISFCEETLDLSS